MIEKERCKGLYSSLLAHVVATVRALGFQLIYSSHCATKNAVVIPKLKAGFVIAKMELSDMFGVLVNLHYYPNPLRRKVMDYRSGLRSPDAEIEAVMKKVESSLHRP